MKIAILGWGSLVWDPGSLSQLCGLFEQGGPTLRIEFSRVSEDGRLTLVIDRNNGADVPTRVSISTRSILDDAVTDVWIREMRFLGERNVAEQRSKDGTIGYTDLTGENASINLPADRIHPDHQFAYDLIRPWLKTSGFDARLSGRPCAPTLRKERDAIFRLRKPSTTSKICRARFILRRGRISTHTSISSGRRKRSRHRCARDSESSA